MSVSMPFSQGIPWFTKKCKEFLRKSDGIDLDDLEEDLKESLQQYAKDMKEFGIPQNFAAKEIDLEPLLGKGVFLKPNATLLKRGDLIGIYTGHYRLLPDEEHFDGRYTFEIFAFSSKRKGVQELLKKHAPNLQKVQKLCLYVDALEVGNYVRLVNHSPFPNIEAEIRFVRGQPEVVYRATRTILPGEQLLVNYHKTYWGSLDIRPLPVHPHTFMLNRHGKIVELIKEILPPHDYQMLQKDSTLPHSWECKEKRGEAIKTTEKGFLSRYLFETQSNALFHLFYYQNGGYCLRGNASAIQPNRLIGIIQAKSFPLEGKKLQANKLGHIWKFLPQANCSNLEIRLKRYEGKQMLFVYSKEMIRPKELFTLPKEI